MRGIIICCVAVVVALTAVPGFAEVQNIKVGGDITLREFGRNGITLDGTMGGDERFFTSTARIRLDADLTDNVAAAIVLFNERDWGNDAAATTDVNIEQAYITLKEYFYEPLTLTIGRQPLWFGKGMIVGNNSAAWDPDTALAANEFSVSTSFDAIRANLDYNPWTVDLVYARIANSATGTASDDRDLYGMNVGYKFTEYNAEVEGYYWIDWNSTGVTAATPVEADKKHTIGVRGSFDPVAEASIWSEFAFQWGRYDPSVYGGTSSLRARRGWAFDLGGEYRFTDYAWQPKLGVEYVFYSGDKDPRSDSAGKYKGWSDVARGKFDTALREFQGTLYATGDQFDVPSNTNQHQIGISGEIKPTDNLTLEGKYSYFRMHKSLSGGASAPPTSRGKSLGSELDLKLTYDYTEDVEFGLLAAWFFPGDYYDDAQGTTADPRSDSTASEVVSTVKVTF